jgi:hypothetical protein
MSVLWAMNPIAPVVALVEAPVTPKLTLQEQIEGGDVSTTTLRLFIEEQAELAGISTTTAVAIAVAESNLIWNAKNPTSSASGVYQWISSSWNSICKPSGFEDVFNPIENIKCAINTLEEPQGKNHWNASRQTWSLRAKNPLAR